MEPVAVAGSWVRYNGNVCSMMPNYMLKRIRRSFAPFIKISELFCISDHLVWDCSDRPEAPRGGIAGRRPDIPLGELPGRRTLRICVFWPLGSEESDDHRTDFRCWTRDLLRSRRPRSRSPVRSCVMSKVSCCWRRTSDGAKAELCFRVAI
jgi:hypothetical protein